MPEENTLKLAKIFESFNKNLYKTNKITELYIPLVEIFENLSKDIEVINAVHEKEPLLDKHLEEEIKKRELIPLYKKMHNLIKQIKQDINTFEEELQDGDKLLEHFRSHRKIIFENAKKSREFMTKIIDSFNISEFVLKFNIVGTIDLNTIATHIEGRKVGTDIVVSANNLELIYEEVLKSNNLKFRLVSESIVIYFEKDNILIIDGSSKKVKICDLAAEEFGGKLVDE